MTTASAVYRALNGGDEPEMINWKTREQMDRILDYFTASAIIIWLPIFYYWLK